MNLAASRNWLDCTIKLIHFCQMLIQGYMIDSSNIMMLPYINFDHYSTLRYEFRNLLPQGTSDISIPLLRHLLQFSEKKIFLTFSNLLGNRATDVMKALRDFPILTVKTTVKSLADNQIIPTVQEDNVMSIKLPPQTRCLFELSIHREGSSKTNVYSKKLNKQKEEFWFLIFVEGDSISFRKFSFSRKLKRIELPVEMPPQKGKTFFITFSMKTIIY